MDLHDGDGGGGGGAVGMAAMRAETPPRSKSCLLLVRASAVAQNFARMHNHVRAGKLI